MTSQSSYFVHYNIKNQPLEEEFTMNEGLKLDNIAKFFVENGLPHFDRSSILWGYIDAKLWQYTLFSGFAVFDIKNFLIYFSPEEIILIGITTLGDFSQTIIKIPMSDITHLNLKTGLIQSKLKFTFNNENYIFKIPNFVVVAKWQKANLITITTTYINP